MTDRIQLWSCGGGRQSAGMAADIAAGRLPRPDAGVMVRLEWEVGTVWPYVERHIIPALASVGVPFHVVERRDFATKDFWGGEDGGSILLPVYTDQSGKASKLPEYCSGEWKREVVIRWASGQGGWKARGVDMWVGITAEESHRRRGPRRQWIQPVYPYLDWLPKHVSGCLAAAEEAGWPHPPRSRCFHCPNQSDGEWAELTPAEFETACRLDDHIRTKDPHAYLHRSLVPLRQVTLKPAESCGLFGGCSSGMCL